MQKKFNLISKLIDVKRRDRLDIIIFFVLEVVTAKESHVSILTLHSPGCMCRWQCCNIEKIFMENQELQCEKSWCSERMCHGIQMWTASLQANDKDLEIQLSEEEKMPGQSWKKTCYWLLRTFEWDRGLLIQQFELQWSSLSLSIFMCSNDLDKAET